MLVLGAAAACSDDPETNPVVVANEGGTETGPVTATEAKQTGTIADAIDSFEVPGAVVTIAGKSATTDVAGRYEILVPRNVPYQMSVTEGSHYKLNEQEWIVKKDLVDRPGTLLLSTDVANLLSSFLPMRDKAKGLLVVRINPMPPCDSEQGSTLTLEPAGASKITYFSNGRPNQSQPSTIKGESFSGAFSDVDIGVPLKVTVNSPLCEQVPFPVEIDNVTYTGVQKTEPGEALSYMRVYIGPKKASVADAATD